MKIHLAAAALIAVAPPTFAIQSAAAQQAARPMTAGATLAEKHVRTLLKSATPGAKMDYSILTAEVGKSVRDHPEGGDMIIKLGTPQTVTYLGDPRRLSVPHHVCHRQDRLFPGSQRGG